MADPRRLSPRQGGFTLIEALIALALVTLVLLLGLSLLWQQPRVEHRLEAQREALRALEATLEALRSGALEPVSGILPPDLDLLPRRGAGAAEPAAEELLLRLEVAVDPHQPALRHVTASAHYRVLGQARTASVRTMVWRR